MKCFRPAFLFAGLTLLSVHQVEARIFQLTKEKFASYLTLSGSLTPSAGTTHFDGESAAVSYSAGLKNSYSGEFGFISVAGPVTLRFGFEILKPPSMNALEAQTAGGAALYRIDSDITGFVPKLGFDLNLVTKPLWRVYMHGDVGQASVTIKNQYSDLSVAPNTDFESQWKGGAQSLSGGFGIEYAAVDLTSVVLEIGYRQLKFGKLTYAEAVTDTRGAQRAGDVVSTIDGENRTLDLSGLTISVGGRWWLF